MDLVSFAFGLAALGFLGVSLTTSVRALDARPGIGWACAGTGFAATMLGAALFLAAPGLDRPGSEPASAPAADTSTADTPNSRDTAGTRGGASGRPQAAAGGGVPWGALMLALVFTGYVGWDASRRGGSLVWPVGAFLAWAIVVPVWQGVRPLLPDETRRGGRPWDACRRIAIWATLFAALAAGYVFAVTAVEMGRSGSNAFVAVGVAIGQQLAFNYIFSIWFVVTAAALAMGLLLRDPEQIERGPQARATRPPERADTGYRAH